MKTRLLSPGFPIVPTRLRRHHAFTLVDLMVAMGLFMLVIMAVIYSHIFGLKMYGIVHAKLSATQDARRTISQMSEEVRTAGVVYVGNGNETTFEKIPIHTLQQGNALRIYPDADDTNTFVQYYHDAATEELRRFSSDDEASVVARSVTNTMVFASENFSGNVLTNYFNNRVIAMKLQFSQTIGGSSLGDHYQLRTKITRRALE